MTGRLGVGHGPPPQAGDGRLAPSAAVPRKRARSAARAGAGSSHSGERFVEKRGRLENVGWTLCFAGFLLYVYVITTYHVLVGDIAVGLAVIGLLVQRKRLRFPRIMVIFTVLVLWSTIGLVNTRWPDLVLEQLTTLAKLGVILLVVVNAVRSRSQVRLFIIFWLACYALFPLRGSYVNYFIAGHTEFGRAVWNHMYGNANDLAAMSLLMLGLSAGVLVVERKVWLRVSALVGFVLLTLLVFLTQSRGGIIGLGVFGALAMVGTRHRIRMLAVGVITAVVVGIFAPASVWERLGGLAHATSVDRLHEVDPEGSAAVRFQIWQTARRIIEDHPVGGVGLGTYAEANYRYAPHLGKMDTHSTYLNVLAEVGVPGFLVFAFLVFGTLVSVDKSRRRCEVILPRVARQLYFAEAGLLAFLVSGIWGSFAKLNFLYVFLGLIYVLGRACETDWQALKPTSSAGARLGTRSDLARRSAFPTRHCEDAT